MRVPRKGLLQSLISALRDPVHLQPRPDLRVPGQESQVLRTGALVSLLEVVWGRRGRPVEGSAKWDKVDTTRPDITLKL